MLPYPRAHRFLIFGGRGALLTHPKTLTLRAGKIRQSLLIKFKTQDIGRFILSHLFFKVVGRTWFWQKTSILDIRGARVLKGRLLHVVRGRRSEAKGTRIRVSHPDQALSTQTDQSLKRARARRAWRTPLLYSVCVVGRDSYILAGVKRRAYW